MKSFSYFITYLVLLAFTITCTSCQKEYSLEGGGPITGMAEGTAVYTLEGDGGNCAGPVINGNYATGVALQPSNNIRLRVNVTTTGTYILSTDLVNGIQFSTAGSFTTIGLQTITLTGSGTPSLAGMFPFTPPAGLGCAFFVTVTAPPAQAARFTLEGSPGTCTNFVVNGIYIPGVPLTAANSVEATVNVTALGTYSIKTDTVDGINFSQSGSFTTTGSQKVTLQGFGVPLNSSIITFSPNTGTNSCKFSIPVPTPGAPATFVLASNPDSTCSGYAVSSSFYAGTPITGSIMKITVTVNVPGNFTITTNKVNGMIFFLAGSFSSPGTQTVQLKGSGTPLDIGVFRFTIQIIDPPSTGEGGCGIDVSVL